MVNAKADINHQATRYVHGWGNGTDEPAPGLSALGHCALKNLAPLAQSLIDLGATIDANTVIAARYQSLAGGTGAGDFTRILKAQGIVKVFFSACLCVCTHSWYCRCCYCINWCSCITHSCRLLPPEPSSCQLLSRSLSLALLLPWLLLRRPSFSTH